MSVTEILVILGCGALGYWLVAVLLPLLARTDAEKSGAAGAGSDRPDAAEAPGPAEWRISTPRWHEVLGVHETSPPEEIVAAYRRKIGEYHPDKVAQMGSDIRALAEQRSREINAAYEQAMRPRGRA